MSRSRVEARDLRERRGVEKKGRFSVEAKQGAVSVPKPQHVIPGRKHERAQPHCGTSG